MMSVALAYYLLIVSCTDAVWSQATASLIVRWNNQVLVDDSDHPRSLVYLNDIDMRTGGGNPSNDGDGVLICRYSMSDPNAGWRKPNGAGITLNHDNDGFKQFRKTGTSLTRVQLSRTKSLSSDDVSNNGLWTCNGGGMHRHVPLYIRGSGTVTIDSLTLGTSPSFSSTFPTFTLIADTSGGPATNFTWRNNAGNISNSSLNRISIEVNPNNDATGRMNCHYRSTLEVTAVAPGNYTYVASNRVTNHTRMSFIVEGGEPSNLQGVQTGMNTIELTWDPPPGPPSRGYHVVNSGNSISMNATSNHLTVNDQLPGDHSFQVTSLSQHFPGGTAGPETVSVRGAFTPVITLSELTATSVRVSWSSPPMFSFTVTRYEVAVRRLTNCSSVTDMRGPRMSQNADDRVELFEGLEEYINYRVEITTLFLSPSSFIVPSVAAEMEFTTLTIAPSEVPSNVVPITTSRTIKVSWNAINCRNQNGPNFRYEVDFQRMDWGAIPVQTVVNVTITVEGLQPFTNYTFRVRGVNDFGDGNYTGHTVIQTDEDIPGIVSAFESQFINSDSLLVTWSPPLEPNGIIIMYELTYQLNQITISENISSDLNYAVVSEVNTTVTEVRLRAYTIEGPGSFSAFISFLPLTIMNVQVESLTETKVLVTWDYITEIPNITEYIVYYAPVSLSGKTQDSEQNVTVPSTQNSAEISGLESTVEYQYQVTFISMFGKKRIEGERSQSVRLKIMEQRNDVVVVVVVIAIAAVIAGIILVVLLVWLWHLRTAVKKKSNPSVHLSSIHYATAGQIVNMLDVAQLEPQIDEFPEDTVAVEGESVVLKVVVSGKPDPTLTWYCDEMKVTSDCFQEVLDDGSLKIPSAAVKQSGVYKLQAANSVGSVQQHVKLTVQPENDTTPTRSITKPVPVTEFGEYVAKNHSNSNQGFKDQFMALESGDHYAKTIGLSSKFKKLNRFANITNYDHNRIVLKPLQGHSEYTNDFINGCYIDGYSLLKKFIATQGPTPKTLVDFWRLIWQEKPTTIVVVTNLLENNKTKCEQYWPERGTINFGPFKVTLTECQVFADYYIRTLKVTVGNNHSLEIKQFHFTAWPDHGVPDYATSMLAFHRRIASAHCYRKGPMLVHCSAGVGRTGTFICIDNVLEQIKKEKVVDIAGTINKMRHQRMKMVQTIEQYCFLHDAMLEFVTCGDTQISAADLRMKMAKFQNVDCSTGLSTFQSQFAVLEQVSPKLSDIVCKGALHNYTKNRSTDYLPPDRYRVILKGELQDYIHALFVNGYKHQKAYMIAEGPMSSTTRNMLKLLYDRKCGVIVMLSGLQENGKESCFQYWPALSATAGHGEYTVELVSEEALAGFTIRKMNILAHKSQKAHQVTQFHITCWSPDGWCSDLMSVVNVINEMEKVQRGTGNMPILVHCSDTVTRSSMFCAMATVIDRCKTEGVVDVFQVVKALRVQRPGAVPTVENYKTIFDATLTFLDSFDTYANFQ